MATPDKSSKPKLPPEQAEPLDTSSGMKPNSSNIDAPSLAGPDSLKLNDLSVKSVTHAADICKAVEYCNKARAARAASIQAVYDMAPPRDAAGLQSHAQSWASNFSTGWLAGLVDPAVMRAQAAVVGNSSLTRSTLPRHVSDWKHKSMVFQSTASRMIRNWEGFIQLLANLAQEDMLHGYAYAAWLDNTKWQPKFFRQENAFVPDESPQLAKDLQVFVVKQDYVLHEFIELFTDEAAAEQAGYSIENCVMAANRADVRSPTEDASTTQFRRFVDMIAEGTLGLTYTRTGPRVVKTWMLWNREYDGSVSFWMIERESGKLLRYVNKMYTDMNAAVSLFALQPGNGHLHSSKGIGRKLIGTALAVEQGRNNALDASRMGALLLLKVDAKDRQKLQTTIAAPFAVFDKNVDIEQQRFSTNADEFLKLDGMLSNWAQQSSGSYVSAMRGDDARKTATEASIDANREQEQGDQIRARWLDQVAAMIGQMQIKAFSDDNLERAQELFKRKVKGENPDLGTEPEILALVEMLESGLVADEIKFLRKAPASGLTYVEDVISSNGISRVAQAYTGNPNIDQMALLRRNIEAMAGPEAVEALVIENIDQTITSEAAFKQLSESATMLTLGMASPVSPRDNHLVHGLTLKALISSTFPTLSNSPVANPTLNKALELNLNHFADHLAAAAAAGASDNPKFKELEAWHAQTVADFKKVIAIQAQAQAAAQPGTIPTLPEAPAAAPEPAATASEPESATASAPSEVPATPEAPTQKSNALAPDENPT